MDDVSYVIIELQTNNGVTSVIPLSFDNYNVAEQQYHTALAAAAVSSVKIHSVSMLTNGGKLIKYECYVHNNEEE